MVREAWSRRLAIAFGVIPALGLPFYFALNVENSAFSAESSGHAWYALLACAVLSIPAIGAAVVLLLGFARPIKLETLWLTAAGCYIYFVAAGVLSMMFGAVSAW